MKAALLSAIAVLCLHCDHSIAFRPSPEVKVPQGTHARGALISQQYMSRGDERLRQEVIEMEVTEETIDSNADVNVHTDAYEVGDKTNRRKLVLGVALGSLASVAVAAKYGNLPGIPSGFEYTDAMIARDLGTALLGGALGYLYVKLCTTLAANGTLQSRDSRKLIHTLSAPLYMFIWPLFTPAGRFFAACVPLINAIRLYLAANGDTSESDLANAVSRSGEMKEALGGPFIYVIIMLSAIILFWRESLVGVVAMSTMAAGDGMADLIGRRFGKNNHWFFSDDKSVVGTAAFVLSASLCTCSLAAWLSFTGCLSLPLDMPSLIPRVVAITATSAFIELLPIGDDNWNVPISAAVLAAIFLQ